MSGHFGIVVYGMFCGPRNKHNLKKFNITMGCGHAELVGAECLEKTLQI